MQSLADKLSVGLKEIVEVTSDYQLVQKLRKIVQPEGKKATWLRDLSDSQLLEIYHRLKLNHPLDHIVKIVQKEWKVLPESQPRSLRRALQMFRDKTVGLLKAHERSFPTTEEKKEFVKREEKRAQQITQRVDGMVELEWLARVQKGRLASIVERERVGVPSRQADYTAEQLRLTLDTLLKHAEELGLVDVRPKEWNLNLKAQFDGLLENVVRDDGSKMITAANRFLELAEKKSLIMKKVSEGKYERDDDGKGS